MLWRAWENDLYMHPDRYFTQCIFDGISCGLGRFQQSQHTLPPLVFLKHDLVYKNPGVVSATRMTLSPVMTAIAGHSMREGLVSLPQRAGKEYRCTEVFGDCNLLTEAQLLEVSAMEAKLQRGPVDKYTAVYVTCVHGAH